MKDFDDGVWTNYGWHQQSTSTYLYPHPHSRELDAALYMTYYKDMKYAHESIADLYNKYCLREGEPPVRCTSCY